MVRGGRGYSSHRGSSYRGSSRGSPRGFSSWNERNTYAMPDRGPGRLSSSFGSSYDRGYDSRASKYGSERFSSSRGHDDYHKSYRPDSYSSRDSHRSPERKRPRSEAQSSRHESFSSSSYPPSRYDSHSASYSESRRSYSDERHTSTPYSTKREEFRRPSGPPPSSRGRGRISTRGIRGMGIRSDRPRKLIGSSYGIRRRVTVRPSEYSRRLRLPRLRSTGIRRGVNRRRVRGEKMEISDGEKDEEEEEEEAGESAEKTTDEEPKPEGSTEAEGKAKPATTKKLKKTASAKKEAGEAKARSDNFIKLVCPHCNIKVRTFRSYEMHLQSRSHLFTMRKVGFKQRSILAQMRKAQRISQNELEKKTDSDDLTSKTNFCIFCKLNYKQQKSVHQSSEAHKNIKKFLSPFCKVCNVSFKGPMIYEYHCCSIDHIKKKQRTENDSDGSGEMDLEDLEAFTTIDSVGEGDDNVVQEDKEKPKKELVNVGIEQIKEVKAHYCDLCKMYLPRGTDEEMPQILTRHCKLRVHMQRYVRFKENQELEKRAEKLQRKELAEKEKKKDESKEKDSPVAMETEKIKKDEKNGEKLNENTAATVKISTNEDDKLWADVDKDLGEILAEADGNKSSDEDEDDSHVNGERYDRFKLSDGKNEKSGEEKTDDIPIAVDDKPSENSKVEDTK